jgi:hypothetical protein
LVVFKGDAVSAEENITIVRRFDEERANDDGYPDKKKRAGYRR